MQPEALSDLAARQYSLFTRRQAFGVGLTAKQIERGTSAGLWVRVYRGVYRMAGAQVTEEQGLLAAVFAGGAGAMASHRGAAWAWGLSDKPALEVAGRSYSRVAPGVITFHRQSAPERPVVHRKIPCTNPLRTIVDLAGLGDKALLQGALDQGVSSGLVSTSAAAAELDRRAGKGWPAWSCSGSAWPNGSTKAAASAPACWRARWTA